MTLPVNFVQACFLQASHDILKSILCWTWSIKRCRYFFDNGSGISGWRSSRKCGCIFIKSTEWCWTLCYIYDIYRIQFLIRLTGFFNGRGIWEFIYCYWHVFFFSFVWSFRVFIGVGVLLIVGMRQFLSVASGLCGYIPASDW